MDDIKLEALRIAANAGEPVAETMKRASAYEDFLRGVEKSPASYLRPAEASLMAETKKWVGV